MGEISGPCIGSLAMQELKKELETFLSNIDYQPPPKPTLAPLRDAVARRADALGLSVDTDDTSRGWVNTAITVAAEMYPNHPFSCQVYIATLTWLAFIIDDRNKDMAVDLDLFQQRLLSGTPQPNTVLTGFAEILRETYKHYDPLIANFINESALAYVTANAMESHDEYQQMKPPQCAVNWPYYFRGKEGIPEAYMYFIFPKALYPNFTIFLPAAPDMIVFSSLTNDILSFYKEEVAGETANYVHKVMHCHPDQTALDILGSITVKVAEAYQQTLKILGSASDARYRDAWVAYVMGYCAMHLRSKRYRLADVVPHRVEDSV